MRSKTKVEEEDFNGKLEDCEVWSFDGSSTRTSFWWFFRLFIKTCCYLSRSSKKLMDYLVMTEVLNADGTPHESNGRAAIDDEDNDFWFGFEQEYFIMDTKTAFTT